MKIKRKYLLGKRDSRIKSLEAEIKRLSSQNKILIETDKKRTEFFSNISHDLRTPISSILGAVQLIDQKNLHSPKLDKHNRQLSMIKINCYRLLRLVNNILDITKFESGYTADSQVNCNLSSFLREITDSVAPFAQQKNITLEFHTEFKEIITAIYVDKMERILLNLLSNAIKFTQDHGRIDVKVTKKKNTITISVKDTGIGIPKNMQKNIFERYHQLNTGLTRKSAGSGIGLSIVKSFVELHGGDIKLISNEGMGSEFIVSLKTELCAQEKESSDKTDASRERISKVIDLEFSDIKDSAT